MKFRLIESVMDKLQELHNILGSWEYGAIQDGKRYDENSYHEIDFNKWVTRPIDQLEKDKIGNCWDFVHYQHYWLNKNKIDNDTYMLYIDKDGNPDNAITHSFTIIDNKYWFEEAAYPCRGTHKINDIKDVAEMINDKIYHVDCKYYIWKYNPDGLVNGLNSDQYMKVVTLTDPIVEGRFSADIQEDFKITNISYPKLLSAAKNKNYDYVLNPDNSNQQIKIPEKYWDELYDALFDAPDTKLYSIDELKQEMQLQRKFQRKYSCIK